MIKLQPRIIACYKILYSEQCAEVFDTTIVLGRALYHEGHFQEAEELVSEGVTMLQRFRKAMGSATAPSPGLVPNLSCYGISILQQAIFRKLEKLMRSLPRPCL